MKICIHKCIVVKVPNIELYKYTNAICIEITTDNE